MSLENFSTLNLHSSIHNGIRDLGFDQPTPIQRDSIPPGLEGRDVLACAATGSGKTAAFLIPILQRLVGKPRGTTRALILTPTRELAAQIVEHFEALAKYTNVRAAAVYGGVGMNPQEQAFRRGVDVIVACPGRLLDHFTRPYARVDGLEVLVLDEVDRMLDMGFLPDVKRVLRHLPDPEQALFFSATLARPIAELAYDLLNDPVTLHVERASRPASGIKQTFWPVPEHLKRNLLLTMIESGDIEDALVFTRTKHRANRLSEFLSKRGVSCDRIHGNRSQAQRTRALADFKNGRTKVLVATDIAARGIDVTELSHVINFDVPHVPEDYIHRIGRTARAGNTGDAFTFVTSEDTNDIRAIERAVGRRITTQRLEDFDYTAEAPPKQPGQESNHRGHRSNQRGRSGQGSNRRPDDRRRTDSRPGQRSDSRPGQRSDSRPGQRSDSRPGQRSDSRPGQRSDSRPGQRSDSRPGQRSDSRPGQRSDSRPGQRSDSRPGQRSDSRPGQRSDSRPGQRSDSRPGQRSDARTQSPKPRSRPQAENDNQSSSDAGRRSGGRSRRRRAS